MDGTVELERLDNVLYVGRPAFGQEQGTISLFKVTAGTCEAPEEAERDAGEVGPQLGEHGRDPRRAWREGDCVILSDMSAWDGRDRVRLR